MHSAIELSSALVSRESVTPQDAGCQELIASRLESLGFDNQPLQFNDVSNLWSTYGTAGPLFVFAGHTDVVPAGDLASWNSPPFEATIKDGKLYGRGAADMKSSVAAMIVAVEELLSHSNPLPIRIGFLITSDEEGPAIDGTKRVMQHLTDSGIHIDYCIVGEPSCSEILGDTIRVGRRGSLNGQLTVNGKQGHVAYAHLASNPIHAATAALQQLVDRRWDNGNDSFPPTSFQISNISAGDGTENLIPATLKIKFNFRYSTELTDETIKRQVEEVLDQHGLEYNIQWKTSGHPFSSDAGPLTQCAEAAINKLTGVKPARSTAGGTSDGRFIAPSGAEVIEFGPINKTIHQINEHVDTRDVETLVDIYRSTLEGLCKTAAS